MWGWLIDIRTLRCAWRRMASNRGARTAGVDRMTVGRIRAKVGEQLWRDNLDERRATIRMRIVSRSGAMIVAARHERKPFNVPERRSR
jgi:retron-type reverse transcriptase